jgi:hypothetical protein
VGVLVLGQRRKRKAIPDWRRQRQRQATGSVFDELVAKLGWPALLTHDAQTAIADGSPTGVCGISRRTPASMTNVSNRVSLELDRAAVGVRFQVRLCTGVGRDKAVW